MNTIQNVKNPQEAQLTQQLKKVLGGDERKAIAFTAQLITTLKNSPKVAAILSEFPEAKTAFFSRMITLATCGLSPEPQSGHVAMIPFKNKINIIIMAGGWCKIAKDNNVAVLSQIVYENDFFKIHPAEPKIEHEIKTDENCDRGNIIGYYAQATDLNYRKVVCVEYMSVKQVKEHAENFKLTKTENSPWSTHFDAMAKKTVVRLVMKNLGLDFNAGIKDLEDKHSCDNTTHAPEINIAENKSAIDPFITQHSTQIGVDVESETNDTNFPK